MKASASDFRNLGDRSLALSVPPLSPFWPTDMGAQGGVGLEGNDSKIRVLRSQHEAA